MMLGSSLKRCSRTATPSSSAIACRSLTPPPFKVVPFIFFMIVHRLQHHAGTMSPPMRKAKSLRCNPKRSDSARDNIGHGLLGLTEYSDHPILRTSEYRRVGTLPICERRAPLCWLQLLRSLR